MKDRVYLVFEGDKYGGHMAWELLDVESVTLFRHGLPAEEMTENILCIGPDTDGVIITMTGRTIEEVSLVLA